MVCCRYVAASLSAVWRHPCLAVWRPPCFLWWIPPCLLGGGCVVLLVGGMGLVVSPLPTRCALSPARSPLSSVGCVTSPGRHNRSFSVLGAPRHQGATARGLLGLCPQPEGPPKQLFLFFFCFFSILLLLFFVFLFQGAPRPQGATIHHHVHCSPCRRPCRLHVGSPGRYT